MKNVLKAFSFIALVAIIGFSFAACDDGTTNDNGGGGGGSWDAGKGLKGTSWEQRDTSSGSVSYDFTNTITFTSDDSLTIKVTGWTETRTPHVDSNWNVTYTTDRTPVNETYTGTYTYYSNIKEGYMSSAFWTINPWNFRILSDNRTMAGKLDTNQFTKK